eukprot:5065392-Alexandrium_andersonii.AAC.1
MEPARCLAATQALARACALARRAMAPTHTCAHGSSAPRQQPPALPGRVMQATLRARQRTGRNTPQVKRPAL